MHMMLTKLAHWPVLATFAGMVATVLLVGTAARADRYALVVGLASYTQHDQAALGQRSAKEY